MKKFEKKDIQKIAIISLSVVGALGISSMFLVDSIVPNFPYKVSTIMNKIDSSNANIESINNFLEINKEKNLEEMRNKVNIAKEETEKLKKETEKLTIPSKVDHGSMMIFLEEKAIQNYLQVLDIDFKKEQNAVPQPQEPQQNTEEVKKEESNAKKEETSNKENTTVPEEEKKEESTPQSTPQPEETLKYQPIGEFKPSVVTARLIGPYHNIEEFLTKVPKELGEFNFFDNVKIWKSKDFKAKEGMSAGDNTLLKDEKNMILEFDIVMYHK